MNANYIFNNKSNYSGLVIDTNLLLLLLIGAYNINEVEKNKRINKYATQDFEKLNLIVTQFSNKLFITQSILTEVTNFTGMLNNKTGYSFSIYIKHQLDKSFKKYTDTSADIIMDNLQAFYKFGLTDCSITALAKNKYLILTDDLPLYHYLFSNGFNAINYAHLILL